MFLNQATIMRKGNFMNKKSTTIIITVICFLSVAVLTVFYLSKQGIINTDNIFTNNATGNHQNASDSSNNVSEKNENDLASPVSAVFLKEGAEYNIQYSDKNYIIDIDEYSDLYIRFNSMEFTKQRGDFDICEDWGEVKDTSGNITNNFSYAVCNVTVTNKGKQDFLSSINNLQLTLPSLPYLCVLRAYNSDGKNPDSKGYSVVNFEPNKEYTFNLAYPIEDSEIEQLKENALLYCGFLFVPNMSKAPIIEKQQEKTDI